MLNQNLTEQNASTNAGDLVTNGTTQQTNNGAPNLAQQNENASNDAQNFANRIYESNSVNHIRLPMPSLQQDNIELWFIQLDHWFTINRITSDNTKFSTTIASLTSSLVAQVFDVVINPPETHKFETIKAALIKNFADSEQKRIQKYVSGLQLGDRKPSHLLNEMRRVGIDTKSEKLLKGLWFQRLPISVQTCLATVDEPLNKLAELADSVMETIRSNNGSVSEVKTSRNENKNDEIVQLRNEVRELTNKLNEVLSNRSRSRTRSATPVKNSQPANDESTECWYHRTYGPGAKKCRAPCTQSMTNQKN